MSRGVIFRIRDPDPLVFALADQDGLILTIGDPVVKSDDLPDYEGPYSVIPGTVEQILNTKNKALSDVITVLPIPENYGLITYNGTTITVS